MARRQSTKVIDTTQSDSVNSEIVEAIEKETSEPVESVESAESVVDDAKIEETTSDAELVRIIEAEQNARRAEEEALIRWRRLGRR